MAALTQAHPSYLATAFAAIEARHGSTERYLREVLGLTDSTRARLQALLLA